MTESAPPRFLNLGCGAAFSTAPEWLNLDSHPLPGRERHVVSYELALGIPFADGRFEAVYHSHFFEHLPRRMAEPFLRECLRVLRPGGILRIVVPDLERSLRGYLACLEEARSGAPGAQERLLWMQAELLDQLVRQRPEDNLQAMLWMHSSPELADFIRSRAGSEFENLPRSGPAPSGTLIPEQPLGLPVPGSLFPASGECHQWMYDSVSLMALLQAAGFVDARQVAHNESSIPGFCLDSVRAGTARKPDSLYIEARRPPGDPVPVAPIFLSATDGEEGGIAAMRLHEGLRAQGVSSLAYVQHKRGRGRQVYILPPPAGEHLVPDGKGGALLSRAPLEQARQARALSAYPGRTAGGRPFSTSEAGLLLADVPLLSEHALIHLHGVSGFIDVPRNAGFLQGKTLVWTLHDMTPFTGGCQHAGGCEKYLARCGACPRLGSCQEHDLSFRTWQRKKYAYRKLAITVVAPNRWLAGKAAKSSLMSRFPIVCIPDGVDTGVFSPLDRRASRKALGLDEDAKILLLHAEGGLKEGFSLFLEALAVLRDDTAAAGLELAVVGKGPEELPDLPFAAKSLNTAADPKNMALAYSAADALVLPALENAPSSTLLEALSCGTPAVSFAMEGVPEIIENSKTGWLAPAGDAEALARCLRAALTDINPMRRAFCRTEALEKFSLPVVAAQYRELYTTLLSSGEVHGNGLGASTLFPGRRGGVELHLSGRQTDGE